MPSPNNHETLDNTYVTYFYTLSTYFVHYQHSVPQFWAAMPASRFIFFVSIYFGIPAEWTFGVRARHIFFITACSFACEDLYLWVIFHSSSCMILLCSSHFQSSWTICLLKLKIFCSVMPFGILLVCYLHGILSLSSSSEYFSNDAIMTNWLPKSLSWPYTGCLIHCNCPDRNTQWHLELCIV